MDKDLLLNLRKYLLTAGTVLTVGLSSGCGASKEESGETLNVTKVQSSEAGETNDEFVAHNHLLVEIGGHRYIIRECEDEVGDIQIALHQGGMSYFIYDEDFNVLFEFDDYNNPQRFFIGDESYESVVQEFENEAINNGAVVYRGLNKSK